MDKQPKPQFIVEDKKALLKIIKELGFVINMVEFNRKWKRCRNELLEQWRGIAESNYATRTNEWCENPSQENSIALQKASYICSIISSLITKQSARELDASSNVLIITACCSLVVSLGSVVFTVLRAMGAI